MTKKYKHLLLGSIIIVAGIIYYFLGYQAKNNSGKTAYNFTFSKGNKKQESKKKEIPDKKDYNQKDLVSKIENKSVFQTILGKPYYDKASATKALQAFLDKHPYNNHSFKSEEEWKAIPKYDRPDLAMEHDFLMTLDPALGYVPTERKILAFEATKANIVSQENTTKTAIAGVNWVERGPDNIGGRTRALMFDPNDATNRKVWAGSVSGGLWYNSDITDPNSSWQKVSDIMANLAITCLAYDPSSPNVFYAGTGEGYFNSDAVRGEGIWKSDDSGTTWNQLASTIPTSSGTNNGYSYIQKIVVNSSGDVFAACRGTFTNRGGVFKYDKIANNWSLVLSPGNGIGISADATMFDRAADIEIGTNDILYASFGLFSNGKVYRSTDNTGTSWTDITPTGGNPQRIELALAPSTSGTIGSTVIYAVARENSPSPADQDVAWIQKSTDDGTSWTNLTNIPNRITSSCGTGTEHFTNGQAWYDLILAVHPTNPDLVIIGGVDLHRSTDGGTNWNQISDWRGSDCLVPYVHADQHSIVFRPGSSNEAIFGNDGGVAYSSNVGDIGVTTPDFLHHNKGYNVTQYYSCAMRNIASDNYFLGGTQDNGSHRFEQIGINSIVEVVGGDGAFCFIDQDNPTYQMASSQNNNWRRSTDGGSSFTWLMAPDVGRFINPADYDDNTGILYAASGNDKFYRISNIEGTGTANLDGDISVSLGAADASAITVSPYTANRVFMATDAGEVFRIDNANTASPSSTDIDPGVLPSGYIACIEIGANDDELLVTYSSYGVNSVWYTNNGGTTWTSKEGNLPDMPIRWALFNPNDRNEVLLATEVGVWSTDDLSAGTVAWDATNSGLANVRCDMMQYRPADGLVLVATHGRGMYTTDVFVSTPIADFKADNEVAYIGQTINFTSGSLKGSSFSWDFGDSNTSTDEHPTHTYTTTGKYTITLQINGAITETKTDYIHILPTKTPPYLAADGGDFESNPDDFGSQAIFGTINLWERGTPSNVLTTTNSGTNAWKTDLDADIVEDFYQCALYSPNFDCSASGTYNLKFRKNMDRWFCNAPFATQVQYSLDKGNTWQTLGTYNDAKGTNWYNKDPNVTNCSLESDIFLNQEGWINNYTNQNTEYDISSLAGNSDVAFRLVFSVVAGYDDVGYQEDGMMIDDFEIEFTSTPLSIELLNFDGKRQNEREVSLEWQTTSEKDNAGFAIEMSEDGRDFHRVGFVNGAGNSSTIQQYNHTTIQESSAYYRLKQVDFEGGFEYSHIVFVDGNDSKSLVKIYPNPLTDNDELKIETNLEEFTIIVFDDKGTKILETKGVKEELANSLNQSFKQFIKGIYILQVISENNIQTLKLMKK